MLRTPVSLIVIPDTIKVLGVKRKLKQIIMKLNLENTKLMNINKEHVEVDFTGFS